MSITFAFLFRGVDPRATLHTPLCHAGSTHPGQRVQIEGPIKTGTGGETDGGMGGGEGGGGKVSVVTVMVSVMGVERGKPTLLFGKPNEATLKQAVKVRDFVL